MQDYDRAAFLATEAHQRQEFAVVLNEILRDSDGTNGNKSKSGEVDSFGLLLKKRPTPTLVLVSLAEF